LGHVCVWILQQNAVEVGKDDIDGSDDETTYPVEGKNVAVVVIGVDCKEDPHREEDSEQYKEGGFSQQEVKGEFIEERL
jgi:hypothetical protein